MTFESSVLHDYNNFEVPESAVGFGDGHTVSATGVGKVKVIHYAITQYSERVACWMTNVLYVLKLTNNLFSVHAATSTGNTHLLATQYPSDTNTAEFRTRIRRSLVPFHPWVSSINLIVKGNRYQLRMLQLLKASTYS